MPNENLTKLYRAIAIILLFYGSGCREEKTNERKVRGDKQTDTCIMRAAVRCRLEDHIGNEDVGGELGVRYEWSNKIVSKKMPGTFGSNT